MESDIFNMVMKTLPSKQVRMFSFTRGGKNFCNELVNYFIQN